MNESRFYCSSGHRVQLYTENIWADPHKQSFMVAYCSDGGGSVSSSLVS